MKYTETATGFVMSFDTATEHFDSVIQEGDNVSFDGCQYVIVEILCGWVRFVAL